MKRGWRAALLTAVLLLCLGPARAQAAGTVTVSSIAGAVGESVDVTVTLTSDDVCSGSFDVYYDSAVLTLVEVQATERFHCLANPDGEGMIAVSFMRLKPISDEVLCTLTFRVAGVIGTGGSAVTLAEVVLRDYDANPVDSSVVQGAVAPKYVGLRIVDAETTQYQAAEAVIELGGNLRPAGGNFSVVYDPQCLEVSAVLPLEAMEGAAFDYHVTEPGVVQIAFSKLKELEAGPLCSVVFRAVGSGESVSRLELGSALMYDLESGELDVRVTDGSVGIHAPSGRRPKLWIVGGALQENGTAKAAVVLQGRGNVCGGNFVLRYDGAMTAEVEAADGCEIQVEEGAIRVSWASLMPASGDLELLTVTFSTAVEGQLTFDEVELYHGESDSIPEIDIRPGWISRTDRLAAWGTVSAAAGQYTVAVDVADIRFFSGRPTGAVTLLVAAYEQGRMVALRTAAVTDFGSGIPESEVALQTGAAVSEVRVFLVTDLIGMEVMTQAVRIPANAFAAAA